MNTGKVVLITGCSTGIGRDAATVLAQKGFTVVATARRAESLDGIDVALKTQLDVTSTESVRAAVTETLDAFGRIDVLINNAGFGGHNTVEETPEDEVQAMFDTNVFGVVRLIQAVAPIMRRQRRGRIVNISSIAGKVATPMDGIYAASKFALEALSDAVRLELKPFGIDVIVVEPGPIITNFHDTVSSRSGAIAANPASPYARLYAANEALSAGTRGRGLGPEAVSQVILESLTAPRPRIRYMVGTPRGFGIYRLMSGRIRDWAYLTGLRLAGLQMKIRSLSRRAPRRTQ